MWIFITICIIGFICGILGVKEYKSTITTNNMIDNKKFTEFLSKECSSFSLAMSHFVKFLFYLLFLFFCCSNSILSSIIYILICYSGFCIGVNSTIIIIVYKVPGIIYAIFCYIPFYFLEVILLDMLFCVLKVRKRCSNKMYHCKNYWDIDGYDLKQLILFIIIAFILFLLESVVIKLTTVTIIVAI